MEELTDLAKHDDDVGTLARALLALDARLKLVESVVSILVEAGAD